MKTKKIIFTAILTLILSISIQACNFSTEPKIQEIKLTRAISTKPYQVKKTWYKPTLKTKGFQQKGIASWYGKKFHGKKTSSGEIFNMYAMSAAHKTLPLGSWVRIENLKNNKRVEVKINDRGPFIKGRIIDLSYAAAKKIDMIKEGVTKVKIVSLGEQKWVKQRLTYEHPKYQPIPLVIQAGAFNKIETAKKLVNQLILKSEQARIAPFQQNGTTLYRVYIGNFNTINDAIQHKKSLANKGFTDTFIISDYKKANKTTEK